MTRPAAASSARSSHSAGATTSDVGAVLDQPRRAPGGDRAAADDDDAPAGQVEQQRVLRGAHIPAPANQSSSSCAGGAGASRSSRVAPIMPGGERGAVRRVDQQEAAGAPVRGVLVEHDRLGQPDLDAADRVERQRARRDVGGRVGGVDRVQRVDAVPRSTVRVSTSSRALTSRSSARTVRVPTRTSRRAPRTLRFSASQQTVPTRSVPDLDRRRASARGRRRGRRRRRRRAAA